MNRFNMIVCSILALASFAASPASAQNVNSAETKESQFIAAAKAAFEKHDAGALVALTCWDRVPEKLKASGEKQYARDASQTVGDITLTNPDPDFPDVVWKDKDGVSYRSNLPVIKQLKITFKTGPFSDGRYPVGEKDGKLYLLEPAPVK